MVIMDWCPSATQVTTGKRLRRLIQLCLTHLKNIRHPLQRKPPSQGVSALLPHSQGSMQAEGLYRTASKTRPCSQSVQGKGSCLNVVLLLALLNSCVALPLSLVLLSSAGTTCHSGRRGTVCPEALLYNSTLACHPLDRMDFLTHGPAVSLCY